MLAQSAPKGAKLVAYLDCGTQRESTTSVEVKVVYVSGKAYRFASEARDVPSTQATVFFDESEIPLLITGLDRSKRYTLGLTWWDYDDGGRSQSVVLSSPDGRQVRLAVPTIRLPNYTTDKQAPAEKRCPLPVTFARDGQMRVVVQRTTGANAVISEVWIWEQP